MERIILDVNLPATTFSPCCLAANPNVRLEGVTTVTGAAGPIEQVTNVVLNTLTLAGRDESRFMPALGGRSSATPRPIWRRRSISRSGSLPVSATA